MIINMHWVFVLYEVRLLSPIYRGEKTDVLESAPRDTVRPQLFTPKEWRGVLLRTNSILALSRERKANSLCHPEIKHISLRGTQ